MKLIKQQKLYFVDDKSDKVYEVDLCQIDNDSYVVNFRYGRRGASLREGSKTVFPVSLEEAEKIYQKLIESKEKKGYSENPTQAKPISKDPITNPVKEGLTIQEDTVLKYLKEGTQGNYNRNWKFSRVIAKAIELNLSESIALTNQFITSNDEFEQYNAIKATIAFNDNTQLDTISNVFIQEGFNSIIGRIAASYLLLNSEKGDHYHNIVYNQAINTLPTKIKSKIEQDSSAIPLMDVYFSIEQKEVPTALYLVYLLFYKHTKKEEIYHFIESLPIKAGTFKSLRYIFRAAELLNDLPIYALIAKRIAILGAEYTSNYGTYADGRWIYPEEEKVKPNPVIAFSSSTKNYLTNTVERTVKRLEKNNPKAYINLSKEILVSLNDEIDKQKLDVQHTYSYNADWSYNEEVRYYPKYNSFKAAMHILYGGSSRFIQTKSKWYYLIESVSSQTPREEASPQLWNQYPLETLYVLAHSKSTEVTSFAIKVIEANPTFLDHIPDELFKPLVSHHDSRVLDLLIDVIKRAYSNKKPPQEILFMLLASPSISALGLGLDFFAKYEKEYFISSEFISKLITIDQIEVIKYLSRIYTDGLAYNYPLTYHDIVSFTGENNYQLEFINALTDLIGKTHFGKLFHTVDGEDIKKLASSSNTKDKLFAATLAKVNHIDAYELLGPYLGSYLDAENADLRKIGVELFEHFPKDVLLQNVSLIANQCFSQYTEVREAIEPTIGKLILFDTNIKNSLFRKLLLNLTVSEPFEGMHQTNYSLLEKHFQDKLQTIEAHNIFELVLSSYEFAQKIGTSLFQEKIDLNAIPFGQAVTLVHSDVKLVRNNLADFFLLNEQKILANFEEALTIFNSSWEDVRTWGKDFFQHKIPNEQWYLERILYLCDHIREDVQAFGRKILVENFKEEQGMDMLLKLQEHPSKTMQFFATNYLNTYAKDNPVVILKLEHFFTTLLFNINVNRIAKSRVYAFLKQEALKNKEVAQLTITILSKTLGSTVKTDKNEAINIMLTIQNKFDSLDIPLTVKPIEAYEV